MPPVTKAGGTHFRKDVEFAATKESDEYELEAIGIVMVPDKVDLQNDFVREETIQGFAEQFELFVEADQASGGIMHAVFPDDWMDLVRNEVLDEAEDINGRTVDDGAWVQRWGISNADLAELIDEDILSGYSIGARQVAWDGPHEQDAEEIDDVDTSEIPDGEMVWELIDGIIREVSAVDIPAVPDAQILEAKSLEKRLSDHLGNQEAFIDEAMERGHSEAEAERLWNVLNDAVNVDGAGTPGKSSLLERAGKAALGVITGSDDGDTKSEAPDQQHGASKDGQTLSAANRDDLKAVVDAAASIFQDAGVDHGIERFTDRDDDSFDLSDHDARTFADADEDDDPLDPTQDAPTPKDAPGGDTPDTTMTDDDTNDTNDEPPEWAKSLQEQIDEQNKRIDEIAGDDDPSGDDKDAFDEAPEWARELKEDVDSQRERIDTISQQSGIGSDQLEANKGDEDADDGLDAIGKALS